MFESIVESVSEFLFGPLMLALFMGTGIICSVRTGWVQFRHLAHALKTCFITPFTKKPQKGDGQIQPVQALFTALSSCIGVGNIAGVATAIAIGGAGAVFWLWVSALFGMATKYCEIALAMKYREKDSEGNYRGGTMYILRKLMRGRMGVLLGGAFAAFTAAAGLITCNAVQSNSIAQSLSVPFPHVSPMIFGAVTAVLAGFVIFGGIKKLASVTSFLTPFMAIAFTVFSLVILVMYSRELPAAFSAIFNGAFSFRAAAGGATGGAMLLAMRMGVARGVFSNEAGIGSSALVHCTAKAEHPAQQAMMGIGEVFIDTIVMCTMAALIILITGALPSGQTGAVLSGIAWKNALGGFGSGILTCSVVLFGFSTIIGWYWYGETAIVYLFGTRGIFPYRVIWLVITFAASFAGVNLIWNAADISNVFMAIPNLICLLLYGGQVTAITKNYFSRGIRLKIR